MARIKITNLPKDVRITKEAMKAVLGGVGMGSPRGVLGYGKHEYEDVRGALGYGSHEYDDVHCGPRNPM